jgi:hypothetical protein
MVKKLLKRRIEPYDEYLVEVSSINPSGTIFGFVKGYKQEYAFTTKSFKEVKNDG